MVFARNLLVAVLAGAIASASAFAPMAGAPLALSRGSRAVSAALPRASPRTPAAALGLRMQEQGAATPLERLVATMPYALPLADGFEWGRYVFEQFPLAALPFVPLFPVMKLLNAPFVSFGLFIVLFAFVTRNPSLPRFVRYNTLQAIYLDIALIFPQLLKGIGATTGIPPEVGIPLTNTVFYAMIFSIGYAAFKNIQGQLPNEIPLISESVDSQMPF